MTETKMAPDIEMIEHLDFDHAPVCEIISLPECDREAKWKVVMKCCGSIALFCEHHMNEKKALISNTSHWHCPMCDNRLPPGNPYSIIEKLP